jgi:hypothetical protein
MRANDEVLLARMFYVPEAWKAMTKRLDNRAAPTVS